MHAAKVKMKDGRSYYGPIYMWRPKEGWFSIPSDDTPGSERIELSEVESAINYGIRTRVDRIEDVDLLELARKEGWEGHWSSGKTSP